MEVADEACGVASDFAAVQDVEAAETVERLERETVHRDVDETLLATLGDASPRGLGGGRGDEGDALLVGMEGGAHDEAFLERFGRIETRVGPDVGDRSWRKEQEAAPIDRLGDPRAEDVVAEVGRVEAER